MKYHGDFPGEVNQKRSIVGEELGEVVIMGRGNDGL